MRDFRLKQMPNSESVDDLSSDTLPRPREGRPVPSEGSFSAPTRTMGQEEDLLCAAIPILLKCFEMSGLDQGIRLPIEPKA
jgi:hypothetical protein